MPRFVANKWKPVDDSTPGYRTVDPTRVVLAQVYEGARVGCPCGCKGYPLGDKAKFAMGHDARLRGKLIRAHLMGVEVVFVVNDVEVSPTSAVDVASLYGWKEYLDSAVLRREGKNREVLARALGSERLLQVGRWQTTGQVVAVYRDEKNTDMYNIEYVDGAGNVKRARVPADQSPLAEEGSRA